MTLLKEERQPAQKGRDAINFPAAQFQSRNRNTMENQDNTSPPQSITMTPNENQLEGLPDKELKRVAINMFTQFIDDTNILQENKKEIMKQGFQSKM